jgi:hypothetical protein
MAGGDARGAKECRIGLSKDEATERSAGFARTPQLTRFMSAEMSWELYLAFADSQVSGKALD